MDKKLRGHEHQVLLDLVKEIRKESGLRQQDLADKIGEPQSFISKYESGERRLDILELKQLCEAMEVPLAQFVRLLDLRLKVKSVQVKSVHTPFPPFHLFPGLFFATL